MTATERSPGLEKQELRRRILAIRDALDPRFHYEASLAAAKKAEAAIDVPKGTLIAGYWPIRSEIDPRPLLSAFRAKGARRCLPVVLDKETIAFREYLPDAKLVQTGFGTMGPGEDAPVVDPAIMLMPLAGFDRRGHRLGYGAGHYDRALARFTERGLQPLLIGMAFDCQEVEHVPDEPHDIALNQILTESGLRSLGTGPAL
nr:5-formyltetrahydrofolate cyclo-ligase [Brucella intermedia]